MSVYRLTTPATVQDFRTPEEAAREARKLLALGASHVCITSVEVER
jgi:hypothetical protein